MVSAETKRMIANRRITEVVEMLAREYGYTTNHWLSRIVGTKTYQDVYDVKTGYWGEGTMYLFDLAREELREKRELDV